MRALSICRRTAPARNIPVRSPPMRALYMALALLPLGASACDPDEMDRAMSEICTAGNDAAAEIVQAALPAARGDEPALMQARLDQARHACINGDPVVAAREAVVLARFAARIEARLLGKDASR